MIRLSKPQSRIFLSPARFRVVVAGRRFGKTYLSIPELVRKVWNRPKSLAWYLAPTYRQAKQIAWRELKETGGPYLAEKPNETDLSVELIGGGRIALRGAANYDALRGPGLDFAVMDEYADMNPVVWTEIIRPMLSDRMGSALFIGTPKGMNHFYELHQSAATMPDWAAFQYTTLDGGRVSAAELESARQDMDEKTFRQEYMGGFENFAGRAYFAFNRGANLHAANYQPRLQLCWSLDFNVNPMSSVICQLEDTTTRDQAMIGKRSSLVHVLDEIVLPNSNTQEACEEFARRVQPWIARQGQVSLKLYGDAAGSARSTAGKSDYQIIKEFFRRTPEFQVSYHVPLANPAVRDRVNAMNSKLLNAAGVVGLLVDPRCKRLTKDLEQVAWKSDSNGNMTGDIDKSNAELTHISDALGYLIESEFGLRQAGGPRSGSIAA
jgi:hypothetical protein